MVALQAPRVHFYNVTVSKGDGRQNKKTLITVK